jgi:VWFA-related protein
VTRGAIGIGKTLSIGLTLSGFFAGDAALPQAGKSPEPPARFPAQVEQVTVDVVVTDKKGEPVTGLKKEDLEVYENGTPQTIVSFDAIEVAAAPPEKPAPRPKVSTNIREDRRRPGRTFVIFFDDIHLTPFTAQRAKAAVADFLRTEAREGDRVTLVAAGGGAWWSTRMAAGRDEMIDLVKRLQGRSFPETGRDRMSDYEAMRIHVFRDEMVMNRVQRRYETAGLMTATQQSQHVTGPRAVEDPIVTGRAAEIYFGAAARNRITLEALERSLRALVGVEGRKSLILVSDGFIHDPQLDLFKRLVDASRRANTAIYFVNGRGLEGLPVAMTAEFSAPLPAEDIGSAFAESFEATEGSESLAADSGGFTVGNTNDLTSGFKRIADETRAYYLIGYSPTNAARDGTFRKIQVKVRGGRGIQIRARKGYYAPSAPQTVLAAKPADPAFQHALDSPYEADDIPLRMTHFVREETALLGRARVLVAVEVDIRSLGLEEKEGRSTGTLEFLLVAANRETGQFFRQDQKVDLTLPPATRERITRTWLPIVREFELGTGRYQAKMVVRDKATGRIGTVVHEFEVPDLAHFRVTTPVLSDVRDDAADGGTGDRLAILARRDFPQGASLFCQLEVYGATRLEASRMPRVSMGYQVRRGDGTLYTQDAPSIINPTLAGSLSRMIGFSLENAAPGDYEIVMRVKDELSGRSLELHEPFSVTAPLSPVPAAPSGM